MDKLKPCPFCGGSAEYYFAKGRNPIGYIGCGQWQSTCFVQCYTMVSNKKSCIKAWNERVK